MKWLERAIWARWLFRKRAAYSDVFSSANGRIVLADLAEVCGAGKSPFVPGSPDETAFRAGRQEVWLRIQKWLGMTDEDIHALAEHERRIMEATTNDDG